MNIVVIGLGSMGKRRIRLIQEMYPDYKIFGVDGREDRRDEAQENFKVQTCSNLDEVKESVDCAFICTSPVSHSHLIRAALEKGCHVFTELNLVSDGYDDNIRRAKEKRRKLFLSSTFLYREETKYIKSRISKARRWNYVYHVGQYLPDWHPWENYRNFFLGDKRTNGCREILAIELPWITNAFGAVSDINTLHDKLTDLNIDYSDNFIIQMEHTNGNKGCMIVDVVSPVAVRKMEAYSENAYLSWEGTPESLKEYNSETKELEVVALSEKAEHIEGYRAFVVENAYRNEIRSFFDYVINNKVPSYGFNEDIRVLNLIDTIGA